MGSSTAKSTIYLYAWIRATCACQILARLLLKNDLICCPWSGKRQSFGGQTIDRLINVILGRTTVSYFAGRLQIAGRIVERLPDLLPDFCSKLTIFCAPWFPKAESNAGHQ